MKPLGVLISIVVILWCAYSIAKFVISIVKRKKEKREETVAQMEKVNSSDTSGITSNETEVNIIEEDKGNV